MAKKRILILGAGLAGLSTAFHLQNRGFECEIFEKESSVGGLCRSKDIDGFTFDYCGHLLHFRHTHSLKFLKKLLGNNLVEHEKMAWVYSHDKYIRYPFQANLYGLPDSVIKDCIIGLIQTQQKPPRTKKTNSNFSHWIKDTFGTGISRYFMEPYNTKFWTLPTQMLTCEWLDGLIPVPSLRQVIEGTIKESHRLFGYNAHFWYPKKGGINEVVLALAAKLKNIHTNSKVTEIDLVNRSIKVNSQREKFDLLVSTLPLPEMFYLVKAIPKEINRSLSQLRWNSIFNLNLGTNGNNSFNKHWVYFPQENISFYRLGFPHNFSHNLTQKNRKSIYIEVSYSKEKPINKKKIVAKIKADLRKIGILNGTNRIFAEDINDIKYGYPIYDKNYKLARKNILDFLNKNNCLACGRYGSWRYMSMEDTLMDAFRLAESLKV